MLVLTRYPGEVVMIGQEIRLTILNIRGRQVKLGIDAPPCINIVREEIRERDMPKKVPISSDTKLPGDR